MLPKGPELVDAGDLPHLVVIRSNWKSRETTEAQRRRKLFIISVEKEKKEEYFTL